MKIHRHHTDSVANELRRKGLLSTPFLSHVPSFNPSEVSSVVPLTNRFLIQGQSLLFMDTAGVYLNNRFFSPYECVFVDDLPQSRKRVLGSLRCQASLKDITIFLIQADIIRTYIDIESIMWVEQIHPRLVKVQGVHFYHRETPQKSVFGFTVGIDHFQHVSICRNIA